MLLQPSEHALPIMRADYQAMRQMIYGDYPSFDELLANNNAFQRRHADTAKANPFDLYCAEA